MLRRLTDEQMLALRMLADGPRYSADRTVGERINGRMGKSLVRFRLAISRLEGVDIIFEITKAGRDLLKAPRPPLPNRRIARERRAAAKEDARG